MKSKTLAILTGTAVVLAGAAALLMKQPQSESAKDAKAAGPLLPNLKPNSDKIARLHLRRGTVDTTLALQTIDNTPAWVIDSKGGYPAQSDRVRKLIAELIDATTVETKTSKPDLYSKIGVEDPDKPGAAGTLIEVSDAAGTSLGSVIIGNASGTPSGDENSAPRFFIRRKGEAQSFLAQGNLGTQAEAKSWLDPALIDITAPSFKSAVAIHHTEGQPDEVVSVSKNNPNDVSFRLDNQPQGRELKDPSVTNGFGQAIANASMDDVAPASSVDMSKPDLTATYTCFDGLSITLKGVTKEGKRWFALSAACLEPELADTPTPPPAAAPTPPPPPMDGAPTNPTSPIKNASEPQLAPDATQPQPPAPPVPDPAAKAAEDQAKAAAQKAQEEAAKAAAAAHEAAKLKAAELNKKWSPWVYALPDWKLKAIDTKLEEMLKPLPAPPTAQPPTDPASSIVPKP